MLRGQWNFLNKKKAVVLFIIKNIFDEYLLKDVFWDKINILYEVVEILIF